jgi:hypothetical protein
MPRVPSSFWPASIWSANSGPVESAFQQVVNHAL